MSARNRAEWTLRLIQSQLVLHMIYIKTSSRQLPQANQTYSAHDSYCVPLHQPSSLGSVYRTYGAKRNASRNLSRNLARLPTQQW